MLLLATFYQQLAVTLMVIIAICGVTIQSCSGAWVWLIIYNQLYRLNVPVPFTPVQFYRYFIVLFCRLRTVTDGSHDTYMYLYILIVMKHCMLFKGAGPNIN